jgi:hypothetical protein
VEPVGAQLRNLVQGPAGRAFYYVYAVDYDRGGEWSGKAFMCTRDKEFTIRGIEDCLARGYDRTGFFEVDTRAALLDRAAHRVDRPGAASRRNRPLIRRRPAAPPAQPKQTK